MDDFALWTDCLAGPDVPFPPVGCEPRAFDTADADGDSDVDLNDFAAFAAQLNE
jgi:hypothetical protein